MKKIVSWWYSSERTQKDCMGIALILSATIWMTALGILSLVYTHILPSSSFLALAEITNVSTKVLGNVIVASGYVMIIPTSLLLFWFVPEVKYFHVRPKF